MATQLQTTVERADKQKLKRKEAQDKSDIPQPDSVKEYFGAIWVILVNKTQFDLSFVPADLAHGQLWGGPPAAEAWSASAFGAVGNTILGIGYRPQGGVQLRLRLDETHNFDFTLGLSTALIGNYNASLVKGHDRSAAINQLSTEGALIQSDLYQAPEDSPKHLDSRFRLVVSTVSGQTMKVVISQDMA